MAANGRVEWQRHPGRVAPVSLGRNERGQNLPVRTGAVGGREVGDDVPRRLRIRHACAEPAGLAAGATSGLAGADRRQVVRA